MAAYRMKHPAEGADGGNAAFATDIGHSGVARRPGTGLAFCQGQEVQ